MTAIATFIVFMVIGRLMSGVHWITDIIGGALFSAGIVLIYLAISNIATKTAKSSRFIDYKCNIKKG